MFTEKAESRSFVTASFLKSSPLAPATQAIVALSTVARVTGMSTTSTPEVVEGSAKRDASLVVDALLLR